MFDCTKGDVKNAPIVRGCYHRDVKSLLTDEQTYMISEYFSTVPNTCNAKLNLCTRRWCFG